MMSHPLRSSLLLSMLLAPLTLAHADEPRSIVSPPRTSASPLDEMTDDGRPTPAGIAVLRSRTRDRAARVWVGATRFETRRVRVDTLGITFLDTPRTDRGDGLVTPDDAADSQPGPSLVPWATIDRFETRRSNLLRGILVGALVGAVGAVVLSEALPYEPGAAGVLLVLAAPPTGVLLGGVVGASIPRWQHEWPPATRSAGITR